MQACASTGTERVQSDLCFQYSASRVALIHLPRHHVLGVSVNVEKAFGG
jgi:hypothetical protein